MVIHGDCIEILKTLPDNSVDSCVTDPPYELGFMGKSWDNTGIANNKEMWGEVMRVLKPGGHLLAFSGTRTYHRMAVAIEDAGFEVRDMIEWVYGSGFPKSLNIGKAVDKLQGNEREEYVAPIAYPDSDCWGIPNNNSTGETKNPSSYNVKTENIAVQGGMRKHSRGTSEWEGWGTALKPAHEPICMARKPLAESTVAQNVLKYGTGGINIDESRVKYQSEQEKEKHGQEWNRKWDNDWLKQRDAQEPNYPGWKPREENGREPQGRFPANLIHDNSEEVRECFPETKSTTRQPSGGMILNPDAGWNNNSMVDKTERGHNDSGNASRFFKSIIYNAKASKGERNKGCEELEIKQSKGGGGMNNTEDDVCGKYGSIKSEGHNHHPTVKPIALMEYLIKMVTPKGGTVLDPFMGSGSTGVAAKQNGYGFVGIDMTPEYVEIAKARMEAVIQQPQLYGQPE